MVLAHGSGAVRRSQGCGAAPLSPGGGGCGESTEGLSAARRRRPAARLPALAGGALATGERTYRDGQANEKGGTMRARSAQRADAAAMAQIYNEGIADRVATFETTPRSAEDVAAWFDGVHPIVVVEDEGTAIAFAATSTYRPRACYRGVAEFSVYTARTARRQGAGRLALEALLRAAKRSGLLESRVACICGEHGQSGIASYHGLPRGWGLREAWPVGWRLA